MPHMHGVHKARHLPAALVANEDPYLHHDLKFTTGMADQNRRSFRWKSALLIPYT